MWTRPAIVGADVLKVSVLRIGGEGGGVAQPAGIRAAGFDLLEDAGGDGLLVERVTLGRVRRLRCGRRGAGVEAVHDGLRERDRIHVHIGRDPLDAFHRVPAQDVLDLGILRKARR